VCLAGRWNQFGLDINQTLLEAQFRVLADRSRLVDGRPTSLRDLGYVNAAIDDGWQLCNSGPGGVGFHNSSGWPNVNTSRFPSMSAMTAQARSLELKAGWYENNCHCADHKYGTYDGLVQATLAFVRYRSHAPRLKTACACTTSRSLDQALCRACRVFWASRWTAPAS
jgi:hypothetical protein